MHGRIQRALSTYPRTGELAERFGFDTIASIAQVERIILAAIHEGSPEWVLDGLRLQLELLRGHTQPTGSFAGLTTQWSHGDYHDQQLLFDDDEHIVAVTDWELAGIRPLIYEVIRSLWFSQLMEQPAMTDYVAGYVRSMPLREAECRLGMELWWQSRLHSTWVFQAYYIEKNARVADLFPESFRVLQTLSNEERRAALTERFVRAAAMGSSGA